MPYDRLIAEYSIPEDLICLFLDSKNINQGTRRNSHQSLEVLEAYLAKEGIGLWEVTTSDLGSYRDWLLDAYTIETAKRHLFVCFDFFNFLYESKAPCENPAYQASGIYFEPHLRSKIMTSSEIEALIETASWTGKKLGRLRNLAMVSVMLYCSLRPGQVCECDIEDLSFVGGRVFLTVRRWGATDKDFTFEMDPRAAAAVENYTRAAGIADRPGPLFISLSNKTYGKRISNRSVREVMKDLLRKSGIEDASAYSLRFSSLVKALDDGATVSEVQHMARSRNASSLFLLSSRWDELERKASL